MVVDEIYVQAIAWSRDTGPICSRNVAFALAVADRLASQRVGEEPFAAEGLSLLRNGRSAGAGFTSRRV